MKKLVICVGGVLLIILLLFSYYFFSASPVLDFKEETTIIDYNTIYKNQGVTARFKKKDITSKIKRTGKINTKVIGKYQLTYTVWYHYKKVSKTKTVIVVDRKNPVLKLNGDKEKIIYLGSEYKDEGATAIDEYDGNLTNEINIIGKVDTNKVGSYTVIYKVKDHSNNETTVERKVTVKNRPNTSQDMNNKIPVLMYHYFYDTKKGETGKNSNYMEIHDFENQMKYLKDNAFYFPTYQELLDYVQKKITLPKKSVVITIDDGQASFFDLAVPIINQYGVKVTSFIIGKNGNKFKNYLSDNITYQSHTYNMHRGGCKDGHGGIFQCIGYEEGLTDLKKSINQLHSSDAIAYPYGDINNHIEKITNDAGFKVAFTTKYGYVKPGMNPLQLPRVRMSKGISLSAFKKIFS